MADRFHRSVALAQPFVHSGTVDVTVIGPDEGEDVECLIGHAALVVYTGACNVTIRTPASGLRSLAALLTAAADAMEEVAA